MQQRVQPACALLDCHGSCARPELSPYEPGFGNRTFLGNLLETVRTLAQKVAVLQTAFLSARGNKQWG